MKHDAKRLEICTASLEFESGRVPLVRVWNSRGFTRSPGSTKYAFQGMGFLRIQKTKKKKSVIIKSLIYLKLIHFVFKEASQGKQMT
jgi:hypothetical protein